MAADLSISVSYLSQIESGDRPITPAVLTKLSEAYPGDWASVEPDDGHLLLIRMMEVCSSGGDGLPASEPQDVRRIVYQQPAIARRMIALHDAYLRSQSQLRALDDQVETGAGISGRLPWEQVRDWFHLQENYVDQIDRQAERLLVSRPHDDPMLAVQSLLKDRFDVSVVLKARSSGLTVDFDPDARKIHLDPSLPRETLLFAVARQLGQLEFGDVIGEIADAGMPSDEGRQLLSAGLANYAAGSLLMPYEQFRHAAKEVRHDVDRLRQLFGTSFEQTCHRLSNLQRPGASGLPIFFCKVDMAGNITKRHSATPLQFARFGGACPLWIAHEAVAIPDRILVQLSETPDGTRYVSMAKGLVKPAGRYTHQPRRYAVALGCEERHTADFIYADGVRTEGIPTRIGASCRICPRADCDQRAFPPAASDLHFDPNRRGAIPYAFSS